MGDGGSPQAEPNEPPAAGVSGIRRVGIGCLTLWLGVVSGGMIAVLVSKVVTYLTHGPSCEGVPSCNWTVYWLWGAAIGGVSLPMLVLWVLGKPPKSQNSDRGM